MLTFRKIEWLSCNFFRVFLIYFLNLLANPFSSLRGDSHIMLRVKVSLGSDSFLFLILVFKPPVIVASMIENECKEVELFKTLAL